MSSHIRTAKVSAVLFIILLWSYMTGPKMKMQLQDVSSHSFRFKVPLSRGLAATTGQLRWQHLWPCSLQASTCVLGDLITSGQLLVQRVMQWGPMEIWLSDQIQRWPQSLVVSVLWATLRDHLLCSCDLDVSYWHSFCFWLVVEFW